MAVDEGQEQKEPTVSSGLPERWGQGIQPKVSPRHMALPGPQAEAIGERDEILSQRISASQK